MSGTQEYGCVVESRDKAAERTKDCTKRHDDSDELSETGSASANGGSRHAVHPRIIRSDR
jgi:hypothetical protein